MKKVIAILGMCGSGKSVATDILCDLGYQKVYFGGVTMEKLKEENLEVTPNNEKMMREKLRSELGMGAYAKILLPRILEYSKSGNTVLDGLYSWDEYKILKESIPNLITIAIVADKNIRYKRLENREVRSLNHEEAALRDISEIENIAKAGPITFADYFILNNGSLEDYKNRLLEILKEVNNEEIN